MKYYPICLDIKDKLCVVVGGGNVATRKIKTLLKCGANVKVVSQDLSNVLKGIIKKRLIQYRKGNYRKSDLKGSFLTIGATNNSKINKKISKDTKNMKILVNIVDNPKLSNFTVPSVFKRGNLMVSISTDGVSPALSKAIRKWFEVSIGKKVAKISKKRVRSWKKLLKFLLGSDLASVFYNKMSRGVASKNTGKTREKKLGCVPNL